jgi:hypothetical protein
MSGMPCKMYLSGSEKRKTEGRGWKLQKISPSNKKKYHRIFATCPLVLVMPVVMAT